MAASRECQEMLAQLNSLVDVGSLCNLAQVDAKINEQLKKVRSEWNAALTEERVCCSESTRAMGKTLLEEFQRDVVVQAVAEARTEACKAACNILTKERGDAWQNENETGCSKAELDQLAERLTLAEERLKQ